jgi:hypothetical protein
VTRTVTNEDGGLPELTTRTRIETSFVTATVAVAVAVVAAEHTFPMRRASIRPFFTQSHPVARTRRSKADRDTQYPVPSTCPAMRARSRREVLG